MSEMIEIAEPAANRQAYDNVLDNMYLGAVANRLRQLENPYESDFKRWIWELIQNAKDTIAKNPNRNEIKVRIEIEGDIVRFRHDGDPFTPVARLGLLYKYSDGKRRGESTGRFGTGFLTTHCLSKTVNIESNMYGDDNKLCGFSVTMYREGEGDQLREGLEKMRKSAKYYSNLFDWTTYTYYVTTENGRKAIKKGVENFHENVAQTMLFCKELSSIELDNNGVTTKIVRLPEINKGNGIYEASFKIECEKVLTKTFLYIHHSEYSEELTKRYNRERDLRLDVAIETDSDKNIIGHSGTTSYFCVLPLVGIETQLDEPMIVNSPDFEPETERQSLLLVGSPLKENSDIISDTGINQLIYKKIFPLYKALLEYIVANQYNNIYLMANGLKSAKKHKDLDAQWYNENVIKEYRSILTTTNVIKTLKGEGLKSVTDCIFVKEDKESDETCVYNLMSHMYPEKSVLDNHNWAHILWKDNISIWGLKELCEEISNKNNWNNIVLKGNITIPDWYNFFLTHVYTHDERLLKEYALLPNMNGDLLKKDTEDFKQGEKVTPFIIDLLSKLGKDVKPVLLNDCITAVSLESKYNSQSYSADINKLAKSLIDTSSPLNILQNILPLLSVVPTNYEKYKVEFINQRRNFFNIAKSLFSLADAVVTEDDNLLEGAWKELDVWFVTYVLNVLKGIGRLSGLPEGLDACWLNNTLKSLKVEISKLNTYAVLPNQNGTFCLQNKLYEDNGIPESLKNSVFNTISLIYKDILLDKNIDAASFAINQKKEISSFASDLRGCFASQSSYYRSFPYPINGRYYKYQQSTLDNVALYILSLIPADIETEVGISQKNIYTTSRNILGTDVVPYSESINYSSTDLWQDSNFFVASMISTKIKTAAKIDVLNEQLGSKGEVYIFDQLNSFYSFLIRSNISYSAPRIFPNQEGEFCAISELKKEEGTIDDTIKNIICLLVDAKDDYRHILMDKRCTLQPQALLNSDNAYALIDEKVAEYYKSTDKWKEENFIKAAQLLIEDWGDKHRGTFEEKFPRVFDEKEKILMNVVWKKEKRELMLTLNNTLSEDQLMFVINNSEKIKVLSETNQKLSDENKELRKQTEELQRKLGISDSKVIEEENEILKKKLKEVGVENPIPAPVKVTVRTPSGSCSMEVKERQYSGLSLEEIVAYVSEAKMDVVNYFKELNDRECLGMTFDTERIAMDSFSQLYGIYDRNGNEIPLVVHSYKGPQYRFFDLNWYDWNLLSKKGSMLWVKTVTGLQCIPLYALPIRNFNIAIGSNLSQIDQAKLLTLATVGKEYEYIGFEFGNNMPRNFKNHVAFDYVPVELKECIGLIKQICDDKAPALARLYNFGPSIPLVDCSSNNYSLALQNANEESTMRDLHDLPANDMQAPIKGAGLESLI